MTNDIDDDGFEEILRDTPGNRLAPCSVHCSLAGAGKTKQARRIIITLRTDRLAQDVVRVLSLPRFNVAYNESMRALRIRAADDGRFQLTKSPRGEHTYVLRFPFIDKLVWNLERHVVEPDFVDACTIMIDLPPALHGVEERRRQALLPPPPPPAPSRPPQPIPQSVPDREDDRRLREMLGLTGMFPRTIGTEYFSPSESSIIEALYRRERVNRTGLMLATHDPADGDDERDDKIIDVFLSKMRRRLTDLNVCVLNEGGGSFRMPAESKQRLREHVREIDSEFI